MNKIIALVNNKRCLFFTAIIFLSPFIVFSFWNHLATDDFFIGIVKNKLDFWAAQKYYYTNWHGRYLSIISTSILVYTGMLYKYSHLTGIYFLFASFLSFLFAFSQINKYVLSYYFGRIALVTLALILLILEINIIPQPSTQFYWYSGAITYQQPLIWLFLLAGTLTGFFCSRKKVVYFIGTLVLLFLVHGYNEMITLWILLYSLFLTLLCLYNKYRSAPIIILLMVINCLAASLLLFAPGNFVRASVFNHSPLFSIVGISFAKSLI